MDRSFETLLVAECAPTLAGVKPANLFSCPMSDPEEAQRHISHWAPQLKARGIAIRVLKICQRTSTFLVYLYRQRWLENIIAQEGVHRFLAQAGYDEEQSLETLLTQLSHKLCLDQDFPHEIGIFLGYPLEDVIGFIRNKGRNFTRCGCWKTYGDPAEAEKRFRIYEKCTSIYRELFARGTPIIQLAIAA